MTVLTSPNKYCEEGWGGKSNKLSPKAIFSQEILRKSIPVFLIGILCVIFIQTTFASSKNEIFVLDLNDVTINPVTADYLIHGLNQAQKENAQCIIIKLDTPGGLLESTRHIVKKIFSCEIPVVVYISPSGARAGSAGVFITYASHIAAMAPSTNIGAAHPVDFGGRDSRWKKLKKIKSPLEDSNINAESPSIDSENSSKEDLENEEDFADPMKSKVLNDTVAFIKAMAKKRHRNVEWAIESVKQSAAITETEALEKGVIEIIAKDEQDLLNQIDGRTVDLNGREITLHTQSAPIHRIDMKFSQKFLNILANPNIAYIFLILGFYGLLYEITHPGFGIPGVAGLILLILAFFSMQLLPTNYAGVALILLAVGLFIAEAKVSGMGFLAIGGLVSMILGSMILFDSDVPMMRVSISLVAGLSVLTAVITVVLIRAVMKTHGRKVLSGKEELIGAEGVVYSEEVSVKGGKVFVHGEIWNAWADEIIKKDDEVRIVTLKDLSVKVKRITSKES